MARTVSSLHIHCSPPFRYCRLAARGAQHNGGSPGRRSKKTPVHGLPCGYAAKAADINNLAVSLTTARAFSEEQRIAAEVLAAV